MSFRHDLLNLYRRHVPAPLRDLMPRRLRAAGLGLAYRLTGYPDLKMWQMGLLHSLRGETGGQTGTPPEDALFSCTLRPVPASAMAGEPRSPAGRYMVEFGFHGLKVKGRLHDPGSIAAGHVDLCLDGHLLRRIGLVRRGPSRADILYTVRRPALALFAQSGQLSLRDAAGRLLEVDLVAMQQPARQTAPATAVDLHIPFGTGRIFAELAAAGSLDKKGWPALSAQALHARQSRLLDLYTQVNTVFQEQFSRPLFILYGTLLGQVRSGDFIPGDDDFDVGYASICTTPESIKAEAMTIIEGLVAAGLTVSLNTVGRPFRVRAAGDPADIHLDTHIVFAPGDGHVWIHPRAHLPIPLALFGEMVTDQMRGGDILRPAEAETYLEAHYGAGWRIPDPAYANITTAEDPKVAKGLAQLCLTRAEQRALAQRIAARKLPGAFIPTALEPLYPLARYHDRVGF